MKIKKVIKTAYNNNDGVSLIELLVSILLLTIIVGAFLSAFEVSTRNNITSGQIVDAGYDAQTAMEEIINILNTTEITSVGELVNIVAGEEINGIKNVAEGTTTYTIIKDQNGTSIEIILTANAFTEYRNLVKVWIETKNSSGESEGSIQNIISLNLDD